MERPRVLIVDDDPAVVGMLSDLFDGEGFEAMPAANAEEMFGRGTRAAPDVVLLDWRLPDADGIQIIPQIRERWPGCEVIILTGYGTFDTVVDAIKAGAFHFLGKPLDTTALVLLTRRACEHRRLRLQTEVLQQAVATLSGGNAPVFRSQAMQKVLQTIQRVGPSEASVLITGESGSGKEVVADLLHAVSRRAQGPLVKINCAALPQGLIESELFGSVKGAYTGAHADREGLFRQARGGTLFLDEVAEMPLETQTKLLRVLQDKQARPVGGGPGYRTDCRILAATNIDLEEALRERRLREDLYYRLGVVQIELPPLRERQEDIAPLAAMFLRRFAAQADRDLRGFTPTALRTMAEFSWPGNVRQLENEIQRAVLFCDGTLIDVGDLTIGDPVRYPVPGVALTPIELSERETIARTLGECQGNKLLAARRLGIGRQTLYNKIRRYHLEGDRDRR